MSRPDTRAIYSQSEHVDLSRKRHIKVAIHGKFYEWAKQWVEGRVVLDAGCGEGHGSAILAESARKVVGIDLDLHLTAKAAALYPLPNVEYQTMNCERMTFTPGCFDVVVSNALLEYLPDVPSFVTGAYAALKPGGLFICGTKNLELSLKNRDGTPRYQNHLREYTPASLRRELESSYSQVRLFGERMKPRSEAYIMNKRALKIEDVLVRLRIKHLFPRKWRNYVRKQISGVDVNEIVRDDFEIASEELKDSLYIIGIGVKVGGTLL